MTHSDESGGGIRYKNQIIENEPVRLAGGEGEPANELHFVRTFMDHLIITNKV